ncbi:MAG: hypothetical protein ACQERZ_01075 [Fusobacteriota bacterium]
MKKIMLGIALVFFIFGCSNDPITTKEQVKQVNQKDNLSQNEYKELIDIFRGENYEQDLRLLAMNTLKNHNYPKMKELIENSLKSSNNKLKSELIEESLNYDNFDYEKKIKNEILYKLIENKNYKDFFRIYSNEELDLTHEQLKKLFENVAFKKDLKNILNLINFNKDYEIFFESLNKYFDLTYDYFETLDHEWLRRSLSNNFKLLDNYISKINEENYEKYKTFLLKGINSLSRNNQKRLADLICKYDSPKEFLLSDNYFLQKKAIGEFGRKESLKFYNNIQNDSYEKYRGLILLGEAEYEDVLTAFRKNNEIEYLSLIIFLSSENIEEILEKSLHKLSLAEKKQAIKMMHNSKIDDQKLAEVLFIALDIEENIEARIIYESVILEISPDNLLRLFRKIMMEDKYSNLEKSNIMQYLVNIENENLKSRLLKIGEHNIYSLTREKEDEILLLSKKVKLWKDYLSEIPNSSYESEIQNKIQKYKSRLEDIKKEIDLSTNINHLDEKIFELQESIFNEEDTKKKKVYRSQLEQLKLEKEKYLKKKNQSIEERLENLEEEYIYYKEKVSGINQEIYYARIEEDEELLDSLKKQKTKNMIKMQTSLEKLRYLYGEYLETDIDPMEILDLDTINALKGR